MINLLVIRITPSNRPVAGTEVKKGKDKVTRLFLTIKIEYLQNLSYINFQNCYSRRNCTVCVQHMQVSI